jgi:hypothetical protein
MSEHTLHPEEFQSPEQQRVEVLERFGQHPFANLETYKYFNQTGPEASARKGDFIDAAMGGETPDTPGFVYPRLDIDNLAQQRDELTEILDEVLRLDMDVEENRLLREKVTDRLHEVGIMLLTKIQSNLDPSEPIYEAVSYQLGENMREVYGAPQPEHWRGILGYRLSLLSEVEQRQDVPDQVREAWEFVKERLPQDLPIEKPYQPNLETFDWYRRQLEERLTPAREAVQAAVDSGDIMLTSDGKLDGDNVLKATKIALAARGITGWKVEMTDESNLDTSQEQKTIFIPYNRSAGNMTLEDFDAVMLSHEIDEHVERRVNGDKTGEPVLGGTGCAGYLGWEEGNGKANEALIRGKIDNEDSAFDHYLSGGLALGHDRDGQGRNYGQTFDLVWRMRMVADYLNGDLKGEPDQALRKVAERSYDKVGRIFRGTDGRAPGVILPKDAMTYYLGQAEVWRKWDGDMVLPEEERKAEHQLERSAKINPLRPDHRRVAARALRRAA